MGPVWQNPIEGTKNCFCKCAYDCTASVWNTVENSSDNCPSDLQTNIIAHILSIGGEKTYHCWGIMLWSLWEPHGSRKKTEEYLLLEQAWHFDFHFSIFYLLISASERVCLQPLWNVELRLITLFSARVLFFLIKPEVDCWLWVDSSLYTMLWTKTEPEMK